MDSQNGWERGSPWILHPSEQFSSKSPRNFVETSPSDLTCTTDQSSSSLRHVSYAKLGVYTTKFSRGSNLFRDARKGLYIYNDIWYHRGCHEMSWLMTCTGRMWRVGRWSVRHYVQPTTCRKSVLEIEIWLSREFFWILFCKITQIFSKKNKWNFTEKIIVEKISSIEISLKSHWNFRRCPYRSSC